MKRSILLLFCGGTISMTKTASGALDIAHGADQFFQVEPRMVELADISIEFVDNIDSTNATPKLWERIGDRIYERYNEYDAFIITTGTNTLAYMASALSFSLSNIGKPVVITGAQIPIEAISTDGRNNLVNALRVSSMDLGWVFVVFGSKLILWCRSKKVSEADLDAFSSFNAKDFWEIGIGIKINFESHRYHSNPLHLKNGFEENIMSVTLFPGISNNMLEKLLDIGAKWFVLRGYGTGDVSEYIFPFLKKCQNLQVPVVVTTQCRGSTIMGIDTVGLQALKFWVIEAYDMSIETMTTKLMWIIKQGYEYQKIWEMMQRNFYWEIDTKRAKVFLNEDLQKSKNQFDKGL